MFLLAGCTGANAPTPPPAPLAPPPRCEGVRLEARFRGAVGNTGLLRGTLHLESAGPDTALDLIKPYATVVPRGGDNLDIPNLEPTVGVFVSKLRFSRKGDGFTQNMDVEWTGALEVLAEAPDCAALAVRCDASGCGPADP